MKKRQQILAVILSFALVLGMCGSGFATQSVFAGEMDNFEEALKLETENEEKLQTKDTNTLSYTPLINGKKTDYYDYLGEVYAYLEGEESATLTVDASSTYGDDKITYTWYWIYGEDEPFDETGNSLTVTLENVRHINCRITDGDDVEEVRFHVYPNSLTINGYINDAETNKLYQSAIGDEVTLRVSASSTYSEEIYYTWYHIVGKDEERIADSSLDNNSIKVTREEDAEIYYCKVYDNDVIKIILFELYAGDEVTPTTITLSESETALTVGDSKTLTATLTPSDSTDTIQWSSSDTSVATVNNSGTIKAVAEGTATIKATLANGNSATCKVTVKAKPSTGVTNTVKVTGVKITGLSKNIAAGKSVQLGTTVAPSNAANKGVTWSVSNSKYAKVTQNGKVTLLKKSAGKTVTVTATAKDGSGVKATYKIKSMKGVVKKVAISGKKTVKAGKSLKLKAKVTATKGANKKVKWTSSNTKYAKVSASGKVKTYKAGKGKKVKITAMAMDGSGKKKAITIKIK